MIDSLFPAHVATYSANKLQSTPSNFTDRPTIWLQQTHTNNFVEVSHATHQTVLQTDAAITSLPNVHLTVKHADCLPILFYHPKSIIGAIHAGRKGTEKNITAKVMSYLAHNYQIKDDLTIWFGPAICEQCYQIDRETDTHYNLLKKNTDQVRANFDENQAKIYYSNRCTAHENEHFFSYRKQGEGVAMNWSGIIIKD